MHAVAVVLAQPEQLALTRLCLAEPGDMDVVVDIAWSGVSTGTERLLYEGRMPSFPGMGYPLVPGYESVGRIVQAGPDSGREVGQTVFVPGANCYGDVRGLFGGASSRIVTAGVRVAPIAESVGEQGTLLALAATGHHAIAGSLPDLIVGHGALGRLIARITVALGGAPVVWERNAARTTGAEGYSVTDPAADTGAYAAICDVSGDSTILDTLITRLRPGGEIVLAGFYDRLSFAFPPAFMREARIRIAAQWLPADLATVIGLLAAGRLSLDGLITHRQPAKAAPDAYRTAFSDADCLKMVLQWQDGSTLA